MPIPACEHSTFAIGRRAPEGDIRCWGRGPPPKSRLLRASGANPPGLVHFALAIAARRHSPFPRRPLGPLRHYTMPPECCWCGGLTPFRNIGTGSYNSEGPSCANLHLCPTQQRSLLGVGEPPSSRVSGLGGQLEARAGEGLALAFLWGWNVRMLYVFVIGNVAALLFLAVNEIEPNRRYASALKFLIVVVSAAAIAEADALTAKRGCADASAHPSGLRSRAANSANCSIA